MFFILGADLHVGCADTWTVLGNLSTTSAGSKLECTRTQREEANSHMRTVIGTIYFLGHCYWPMSGFFAWRASSVLKSVFGKRMKIFVLQENGQRTLRAFLAYLKKRKSEQHAALYECRGNYFSSIPSSPCYDTIPSQLVLFLFIAKVVDQSGDAIFQPAVPVGPRLRTQGFIPEIISCTVTETGGWILKGKQKRKVTSAGRPRSGVDRQNQLSWPSGFPSGPDTLPDVWPGHHQTCLHKDALFIDY